MVILYGCKSPGKKQYKLLDLTWPPSLLGTKDAAVLSPPRDAKNVTGPHLVGGTGTLDELADSHTMLAIYATCTICYQRL